MIREGWDNSEKKIADQRAPLAAGESSLVFLMRNASKRSVRPVPAPLPARYGTCAVVGSGGSLYNSSSGAEIDGHDLVLRQNAHPVGTWETDVGRRTDIRLFYPESSELLQPGGEIPKKAVMVPYKKADAKWLGCAVAGRPINSCLGQDKCTKMFWLPEVACKSPVKACRTGVVTDRFQKMQKKLYKRVGAMQGKRPSIGFTAVALALSICDSVDLYGVAAGKDGRCHYHERVKCAMYGNAVSNHAFPAEHAFYRALNDAGIMTVH